MRESLSEKCRLFIENRDVIKKAFPMESSCFFSICSSFFTDKGRLADVESLKGTRALLKSRLNVFSNFRGAAELSIISLLALDGMPERRIDNAIRIYKSLKERFFASEYLPIAAMILSEVVEEEKYDEICERTRRLYDLMRREHPLLTSSEDSVYFAMLALSDRTDEEIISETETCYNILKKSFSDKNAVQSLAFVLALSEDGYKTPEDKCRDTVRLFNMLKEKKHKYGTGYELATLGVLAMLPCGLDQTANDLIEISGFLKEQKGYGFWGIGKNQRLMHAGMITVSEHLGGSDVAKGAAIGSTLSLIAAQQAATCAAIAASVAAANAARSAN